MHGRRRNGRDTGFEKLPGAHDQLYLFTCRQSTLLLEELKYVSNMNN